MAGSTHDKSRNYARVQSVLLGLFALAVFFGPGPLLLDGGGVPRLIGTVFCAAGLLLLGAALAPIRRAIQIAPEPRADASLVTTGIYGRLRHPIYTAIVMLVVGLFLRRPTFLVGLTGAAIVAFLAAKVRFEERLLSARYPEYPAYRKRTWGLILWPRSRR